MSAYRNVHVKQEGRTSVCFVCGGMGTEYTLHSRTREHGAFFPFLEQHKPPSGADRPDIDGAVSACFVCYSFLLQQWDDFERTNTPYAKRAYWLKRTDSGPFAGMDVVGQPEFASQYLGLPAPQNNCNYLGSSRSHASSPVELQRTQPALYKQSFADLNECLESTSVKMHTKSESSVSDAAVLDLRVPSRPPSFSSLSSSPMRVGNACYVCGDSASKAALINIYSKPIANCPFFPNLATLTRPPAARPMDGAGKVECCEKCHANLICQWDSYQRANMPHSERFYHFRNNEASTSAEVPINKSKEPPFVCFTCGYENAKSLRKEVNVHRTVQDEPCFRFLKWHMPAPGAKSISKDGKVFLCSLCYKSLLRQFAVYQMEATPHEQRVYKIPNAYAVDRSVLRDHLTARQQSSEESCLLCEKFASSLVLVETLPQCTKAFYPFLKELDRSRSRIDYQGRVPVCTSCYSNLSAQWETFEASQVPHSLRNYAIGIPKRVTASPVLITSKNNSSALHIQVSSPEDHLQIDHQIPHEPLLTTVTTLPHTTVITTPSTNDPSSKDTSELLRTLRPHATKDSIDIQDTSQNAPRVYNPLELPVTMNPLPVATTCFICAEYSPPGYTYYISAFPVNGNKHLTEDWQTCTPFFPFLAKHVPSSGSERLTEDGNAMVCTFCCHSLQAQWLAYETSPHVEDGNRWQRKYNTHHYVCYICGITTYRKRARSITVKDFPFLVEHPRPPGALALHNGESVVTCLTCFESLMSQWKDYERIKLAVELRKYNWIVLPPPPEADNSRNTQTQPTWEPSSSRSDARSSSAEAHHNSSLPHGPKPPPLTMQAPCGTQQKALARSMTTASPLYHQMGPHANSIVFSANNTPAFNAARTSSFAAALRKLAKQAVDPITEKDLSPITPVSSPALSQRSATPKHGYLNNHQVVSRAPSPPPPVPVHPSHLDRRKPMELGSLPNSNTRLMEPLSLKIEPSKVQSHHLHNDKRDDHMTSGKELGGSLLQVRPSTAALTRPEELHPSCRGFQPYRVVEESRHASMSAPSHVSHYEHPAPSPAYPYHPAFLPHLPPHPAYRFDDPVYLEHYGMLRPPMMHLPHPSVPFYRYPRDVLTQPVGFLSPGAAFNQDRIKLEERHREDREQQELERRETEASRESEVLLTQRESPSATHLSRGSESPATRMGSITHGTPRDLLVRKCSAPLSPPTGPLNLVTHPPSSNHEVQRSRNQDVELWVARQAALENQHRPLSREYHEEASNYKHHYLVQQELQASSQQRRFDAELQKGQANKFWNERERFPTDSAINSSHTPSSHSYNGLMTTHSEDKTRIPTSQSVAAERQSVIAVDARSGERNRWTPPSYQDGAPRVSDRVPGEDEQKIYPGSDSKKHSIFNGSDAHAMQRLHDSQQQQPSRSTNQEPVPKVVSKLDIEEERLRKARLNGSYASDDSLSDYDDENEFRTNHFVIITKGPALKLDTNPKKMAVLSTVGLVTHSKKKELELNKFLRRRRILQEREKPLPIINDNHQKLPSHLLLGSFVSLSDIASKSLPDSTKVQFFESIGLRPMPSESKEELERAWRIVVEERARRHNVKLPLRELHSANLLSSRLQGTKRKPCEGTLPNGVVVENVRIPSPPKKPLTETAQSKQDVPPPTIPVMSKKGSPEFSSQGNLPKLMPVPPQDSERRVVLLSSETSVKDPQSRQLAREFAQEFHELVLQTTKQQLEHNQPKSSNEPEVVSQPPKATNLSTPSSSFQPDSLSERTNYNWPGVEALMEAYHRHQAEQNLEKEVLSERCQYLQNNTRELDGDAERLSQRMSELLRLKRQLDEERQRHQVAIDNLKCYLRQVR